MVGNTIDGTGTVRLDDEMRAYDMLGPLTRKALREARYQIGAASLVRALIECGANLADPRTDRAGVRAIRQLDCQLAFQFSMGQGTL
jgi:hypothetical protein